MIGACSAEPLATERQTELVNGPRWQGVEERIANLGCVVTVQEADGSLRVAEFSRSDVPGVPQLDSAIVISRNRVALRLAVASVQPQRDNDVVYVACIVPMHDNGAQALMHRLSQSATDERWTSIVAALRLTTELDTADPEFHAVSRLRQSYVAIVNARPDGGT